MSLNREQRQAVDTRSHCLVLACPGAGKTKTIVTKVGAILSANPSARIGAFTFTRDSANEMKDRIAKEHGKEILKSCVIGTFHSIAIRLLARANKIGRCLAPKEQSEYVERARRDMNNPDVSFEQAQTIIEKCKCSLEYKPADETEKIMLRMYSDLLKRNKVIDLYDVITSAVTMIRRGELAPLNVTHMLVDEFQDTDAVQFAFIMEHVKAGTIVTVVGDDDQSIYGWRDALGYSGMQQFKSLTGAEQIVLGTNYRCHEEILSAADRLISNNKMRVEKRLFAHKGAGGHIEPIPAASRGEEADKICDAIAKEAVPIEGCTSASKYIYTVPAGSWVVLARTNRLLKAIDGALTARRIKHFKSGKSFWQESPVILMLSLLRAVETGEKAPIDQILHWAGMSTSDLDKVHAELGDDFHTLLGDEAKLDKNVLSPEGRKIFGEFAEVAPGWHNSIKDGRPHLAIGGVEKWMSKYVREFYEKDDLELARDNLKRMKGSLASRIFILTCIDNDDDREGVALHTMHGCKGLEFTNVWIAGAEEGAIPSTKEGTKVDEERRLMFVAITRAKKNLYLSYHVNRGKSRFVDEAQINRAKIKS